MNDWGKFQDVKIKRASVELVWSNIGIKRFLCKLDMFLEECANILIGDEFGILCLAAKQVHSITEKCSFVSIGEPRSHFYQMVERAPNWDGIIMGAAHAPVQVTCPMAIQHLLEFPVHHLISCLQSISTTDHHGVDNDPDQRFEVVVEPWKGVRFTKAPKSPLAMKSAVPCVNKVHQKVLGFTQMILGYRLPFSIFQSFNNLFLLIGVGRFYCVLTYRSKVEVRNKPGRFLQVCAKEDVTNTHIPMIHTKTSRNFCERRSWKRLLHGSISVKKILNLNWQT